MASRHGNDLPRGLPSQSCRRADEWRCRMMGDVHQPSRTLQAGVPDKRRDAASSIIASFFSLL
jgi:hypothetical protein